MDCGAVKQIFHELAVHEPLEMFIDVLPRDIFPVCHPLEVGKEIAFHLGFVKEAVVLVEDGLITPVTQYLRFFHHACVEIAFLLVGRFGEDINPQSFTGNHFHGDVVTVAGIIIQTQRILCPVLHLALAQGDCLAFTHIDDVLLVIHFRRCPRVYGGKGTT